MYKQSNYPGNQNLDIYYHKRENDHQTIHPPKPLNPKNKKSFKLWGGKNGKWLLYINKLPIAYNSWQLRIGNINYLVTQEQLSQLLLKRMVKFNFVSFMEPKGTACILCHDKQSFINAMHLGGFEVEGRTIGVSFDYPIIDEPRKKIISKFTNEEKLPRDPPARGCIINTHLMTDPRMTDNLIPPIVPIQQLVPFGIPEPTQEIPISTDPLKLVNYESPEYNTDVIHLGQNDMKERYNLLYLRYLEETKAKQIYIDRAKQLEEDNEKLNNVSKYLTSQLAILQNVRPTTLEKGTQTYFVDQDKELGAEFLELKERYESLQIEMSCIKDESRTGYEFDSLKELVVPSSQYVLEANEIKAGQNIVTFYKHIPSRQYFVLKRIDFHEKLKQNNWQNIDIQKVLSEERGKYKKEFINQMKASESEYVVRPISLYFNLRYALFLMEYGGHSIDNYWLDPTTNLNYVKAFKQLAYGLYKMHGKLIHHGDIKPQNILFLGNTNTFKFIDFGASLTFSSEEQFNKTTTRFGGKLQEGTSLYLPPEIQIPLENNQIGGENIKWEEVDVFSLAFTIYSMIIKRYPNNEGKLKNNFHTYPQFLIMVEQNIDKLAIMIKQKEQFKELLLRSLSFYPHERYSSIDIVNQLKEI